MTQSALSTPTAPASITAADILNEEATKTAGAATIDAPETETETDETALKKGEEKLSPKLQVLLKRERAALEKEKAAKAREAEITAKLAALEEREAKIKEFESLKKSNPMKALELLGLNYQQLTEVALADGNLTPDIKLKMLEEKFDSRLNAQEAAIAKEREEAAKKQAAQFEKAVEDFKTEIGKYLKENSDRYELISFEQSEDLIYDVIEEHFERTKDEETGIGETMTIQQAADKVEEFLEKKYSKAKDLKKVQAFLTPKPVAPEKPKAPTGQKQKTLTNNLSATPMKPRTTRITDDERIAKAIAYARGLRP